MTARCTMPSSGVLPSNREIADVCTGYASFFPAWKQIHRLQSTLWCEVEKPEPIFRSCGILIVSATGKKWFRCLFELLLADWRRLICIDGFLGHQMTNESESVKCSPRPISKPIDLTLQTPSRSNGLIGKGKRLLQTPIVPKCKPLESQIKGRCLCLPYLRLILKLSKPMVQAHCCCTS